jgi:hypothetical protein
VIHTTVIRPITLRERVELRRLRRLERRLKRGEDLHRLREIRDRIGAAA